MRPPKPKRSNRRSERYQEWLKADTGEPFIVWLKRKYNNGKRSV